jgi:hypothetical protein
LHHDPALQSVHYSSSEPLKAGDLGGNVISFDIEMNPALVRDPLNLNDRLVGGCFEHTIVAAGAWVIKIYHTPERFGPEFCGLINISTFGSRSIVHIDENGAFCLRHDT